MGHLAKKGVQILTDLKPVPPIIGDASRISQILINLVGNALKFTERGQVTIVVSPAEDSGRICLTVRDTGIGIAPDKHAKIFQAFEQVLGSSAKPFSITSQWTRASRANFLFCRLA